MKRWNLSSSRLDDFLISFALWFVVAMYTAVCAAVVWAIVTGNLPCK